MTHSRAELLAVSACAVRLACRAASVHGQSTLSRAPDYPRPGLLGSTGLLSGPRLRCAPGASGPAPAGGQGHAGATWAGAAGPATGGRPMAPRPAARPAG